MELVERLDNRGSYDQSAKPLVIRRNHEPRRVLRRRILNDLLVSFLVIVPETSLVDVSHGEFPVLLWIFQPLEEPPLLLLLRNMQEEFSNHHSISSQVLFERIDVLVPLVPDMFRDHFIGQLLRS